jgi:zinc/manganese transport system substrate-binding protein
MRTRPTPRLLTTTLTIATSAALLGACSMTEEGSTSTSTGTPTSASSAEAGASEPAPAAGTVSVVATTTILGDIAGQVATCGGAAIETLMPAGADPHDFAPSSAQVASMVNADLVVANGLGLEGGMADALASAQTDGARVMSIGELVDPLPFTEADPHAGEADPHAGEHADEHAGEHADEHAGEHADEHEHGEFDPHIWFDMLRMATAAELIGTELTDITGESAFTACGTQTADAIRTADAEVAALLASIPAERRIMVTDHLAYGYLADRYGLEVIGAVIPSTSTLAEPSSAELAELASLIVDRNVPVIFADVAEPSGLVEAVAAETGREIEIIPLYHDLGGTDSPADTYIDLMTTDAERIAEGLAR